jgi:Ca2+-binding EF-hand superfamily protein
MAASSAAVSAQEVQEFREIFNLVDRDGGGTIDTKELEQLMDLVGVNASEDEVQAMVEEIDTTGAGEIEFEDFLRVMSKKVEVNYTPEQVIRSFEILAGNAPKGMIRPDVLKQALTSFGKDKFSEEEANEYVRRLDTDRKGEFINIAEYVRLMMKST